MLFMNHELPRSPLRAIRRLHFTLNLVAALCAVPAMALAAGGKVEAAFQLYDKDSDGVVTRAEAGNAPWFDRADENKDGGLTLEEVRRTLGAFIERRGASPAPPAAKPDESLKEQPQLLKGGEYGVGRMVPEMALKDLAGREVKLGAAGSKATVVACFGASCPLSNKFAPELARLEKEFAAQKVAFVFLNPIAGDQAADLEKYVATYGLTSPVVHDAEGRLAQALGAATTTDVFVLDAARTLVYRGAINDQYGLGYSKDAPLRTYLRDALAAVLCGGAPTVAATTAPGCALDLPQPADAARTTAVTYHRDIARIMQSNCVECHRKDGVAPFSLETMADVIENAGMVRKQLDRGAMPPWFAAPPAAGVHSPWANDRSLSERDKADVLAWIASGRPAGDPKDAPVPRVFSGEWSIGTPDLIVQIPRPMAIKAEGTMPYQFETATTTLTEDKWVQAYEILPTDRSVVHHVIVQVHEKGKPLRDRGEGAEGYWAAYVPGNTSHVYPDGFARKLPAGATVSFQIHYTPNGKATTEQLRMGLAFAKTPPRYQMQTVQLANPKLNIPPGEADHVESTERRLPFDLNVTALMAHMHVRGKAFKFEVTSADGKTETLLDIPRYDFNWQLRYDYATPKFLPRGSTVKVTAVFDNSPGNPANPDPTKTVKWGPQTFDEMMIGYFETYAPVAEAKVSAQ
jgi:mono/diheme cytochrome c family protein/thiol-disulfide isomerase/thioredoxin